MTTNMATERPQLDCGHAPTDTGASMATGVARDRNGATMCYACAHARTVADLLAMEPGDRTTLYASADPRSQVYVNPPADRPESVITWPGDRIARTCGVHRSRLSPNADGWRGYFYLTDDTGTRLWFSFSTLGAGMYANVRRLKHEPR